MDLSALINSNLRKCGEIAAALKVGKIVFTLHCGFCSKNFLKLHAFTLHIGEKHEQELFGYLLDESCDSDDSRKVYNIRNKGDNAAMTMVSEEKAVDFKDSLEQFSFNLLCEEIPVLGIGKDFETMYSDDKCMAIKNDADFIFDSSETKINFEHDNQSEIKQLACELGQHEVPLPNLTNAQNLELIEVYRNFPCLWNVYHIEFRFKNRREEAINEMIEEIKIKLNLNLTQSELQNIIDNIHDVCRQEKHRKLRCERLNKIFTPICKFYEQISFLNDNISPFKCDFCEETFKGFNIYTIHKSKHDNSKPFTCTLCNRGFMAAANLTVHLRRHTRDYPFECKVCKKRFPSTHDVNIHMRGHTGEKPYVCEICGQSLRTWTLFDNHIRRHQKRPSHICTICSKGFYEKTILTDHMNVHFNIRDKVCNVCGKSFTSLRNLRQHKQIHAEKKKFVCKICGKDFAQRAGLHGHMKSHGTTLSGT